MTNQDVFDAHISISKISITSDEPKKCTIIQWNETHSVPICCMMLLTVSSKTCLSVISNNNVYNSVLIQSF